MMPTFTINYLAVLTCAVVAMPVGFLWFGPIFGQAWQRHMGFGNMQPGDSGPMGKAMAIFFVSNLLIAWVLAHSIKAWQASSWGLSPDLGSLELRRQCRLLQLAWILSSAADEPRGVGDEEVGPGPHQRELRSRPVAAVRVHFVVLAVNDGGIA